jgi:beta-glucosidase
VRLTLQPGETRAVTFHLPVDQLAFHDVELNLVLEPGTVELMLGSSSEQIHLRGLIEITGAAKMPVKQRQFVCPVTVK